MDAVTTALKAFVIATGIVLVAAAALLVALLATRGVPERAVAPPAEAIPLVLPAGARIEQVIPDGRRLILLAVDPTGRQYLAVVNPLTGERLSLVPIEHER